MPRAGKRDKDKFEADWAEEMRRDFGTAEPLRAKFEDLRQTDRWLPPLLAQLDEAAVFIVRDAWPRFTAWLHRSFPRAVEVLPADKWAQIGWVVLGLLSVDWVVGLGPRTGHNVVQLIGWGIAGFTAWQVWRRIQQHRRDELAQRFVLLTSQLGAEAIEQRIAALGALDQLAYDSPRYRLPLVHLLAAWLEDRSPDETGNHDCAVARQMLLEFNALLAAEPDGPPGATVTAPFADSAAESPAAAADAEPAATLEVLENSAPAAEPPGVAAPQASAPADAALPAQEHAAPATEDAAAAEPDTVRNKQTTAE